MTEIPVRNDAENENDEAYFKSGRRRGRQPVPPHLQAAAVPGESLNLCDREVAVLAWRLLCPPNTVPLSYRQMATRLGISEERARLIYSAACSKIRQNAGKNFPTSFRPR